ncbi:hypothetical protein BGZ76_009035 [Entomortierella beljakovae]|nr:hypothetical protein BGZ76_009035 [Entomortierella beljakovae]
MFALSWIRSSGAQASNASNAQGNAVTETIETNPFETNSLDESRQDDWVLLPSDHNDLMESSISDLDLLSASMTLYPSRTSTASSHPASSRTRGDETFNSSSNSNSNSSGAGASMLDSSPTKQKSKRQLKQEMRQQRALEELERKPRFDPTIAKMRDQELKMAKMAKLGLRNGRS